MVRIGGRHRPVPDDPLRQEEGRFGPEQMGVASAETEMGAGARDEEANDEEIAPNEEPLIGARMTEPDDMVDSKRGVMTSRGTPRGKLHVDLAHSSGPHWPQDGAGSIEVRGLPLPRIR